MQGTESISANWKYSSGSSWDSQSAQPSALNKQGNFLEKRSGVSVGEGDNWSKEVILAGKFVALVLGCKSFCH